MNYNAVEVLLAEDNDFDAELTIRELKKNNLANNLVRVKNGVELLDFVFAEGSFQKLRNIDAQPRLILLDIKMPLVSGIEALEKIKSDERTKAIPVIMLTSSNEDPDIRICYDLGANSYIVKPVNFDNFTKVIRDIGYYWLLLNQKPGK